MLWQSLDRFTIELHMKHPTIPPPRVRDQVIMEIVLEIIYSTAEIQSINRCRGMLQCIFLSDVVTADGRYLESFVFDPGSFRSWSKYRFPQECPSQQYWEKWFKFCHSYTLMVDKLDISLGTWINPTHRKWLWYTAPTDDLYRIEDGVIHHYLLSQGTCQTRSIMVYTQIWKEKIREDHVIGTPVVVRGLNDMHVEHRTSSGKRSSTTQQFLGISHELGGQVDVGRSQEQSGHKT